jgi:hypothetical protein
MLQNLTNFFNLITNRKIKTTLKNNDLIAVGTRDPNYTGGYQPTAITYSDLAAQLGGISLTVVGNSGPATLTGSTLNIPTYTLSGLGGQGALTLTNAGTSGAATLIGNILNIPNYATGSLPAWVETNATDKTIWCNGQSNGSSNLSYGEGALRIASFMANLNTAIGTNALYSVAMGGSNTAVGYEVLKNNLNSSNTAMGSIAMTNNTTGSDNTAVGRSAMEKNTTGLQNTAIGSSALVNNTTGTGNVAMGFVAMSSNTTGSVNVGIGYGALGNNTSGQNNVAIGNNAGASNTTSNASVCIGTNASNFNNSGCIVIGFGAAATGSNQFVVGSAGTPAGSVVNSPVSQTHYWTVKINGTDYKILLST